VLTGRADEARLETVLARLGDLGIEPVSVERDD
jgi:hypothetical protein